ncbi:hypothetical protein D3C84_771550 [compost metagenome]
MAFFGEETHEALVRLAERFVILGRMRQRFEHRFLLAARECIYIRRRMGRIQQVAVAVPVINVDQPVHQIRLVVAICRFQLSVKRVLAWRLGRAQQHWILVRIRLLRRIRSWAVRIVVVHRRLFFFAVAFIDWNDVFLHVVPSFLKLRPVARVVAVQRLQPQPVAVCFGRTHMAVVRRFAQKRLDGMVRDPFWRKVTVR